MGVKRDQPLRQADCGELKPYQKPTLSKGPLLSNISSAVPSGYPT